MSSRHGWTLSAAIPLTISVMLSITPRGESVIGQTTPSSRSLRLHGLVEPVRSYTVSAPRLAGSASPGGGPNALVVVRLARAGTTVRQGEVVVEFDRHAQLRAARDRESEFRDLVEQINKKRGDHMAARGMRDAQLRQAENDARIAELGVLGNELLPKTSAEKNVHTFEEAKAHLTQLRKTFELRSQAESADVRLLEIQRDCALNAWKHAERNAERNAHRRPPRRAGCPEGDLEERDDGGSAGGRGGHAQGFRSSTSSIPLPCAFASTPIRQTSKSWPLGSPLESRSIPTPRASFNGRLATLSPIATASTMSNRVRTFVITFSIEGTDDICCLISRQRSKSFPAAGVRTAALRHKR